MKLERQPEKAQIRQASEYENVKMRKEISERERKLVRSGEKRWEGMWGRQSQPISYLVLLCFFLNGQTPSSILQGYLKLYTHFFSFPTSLEVALPFLTFSNCSSSGPLQNPRAHTSSVAGLPWRVVETHNTEKDKQSLYPIECAMSINCPFTHLFFILPPFSSNSPCIVPLEQFTVAS